MSITILSTNEDGTYLGADEQGNLYRGTVERIGHQQLTVETAVAEDGLSFTRSSRYGDFVHSQGTVTRAGFGSTYDGKMDPATNEPYTEEKIDALWEAEKALDGHGPAMVQALVDGDLVNVELKIRTIAWEAL